MGLTKEVDDRCLLHIILLIGLMYLVFMPYLCLFPSKPGELGVIWRFTIYKLVLKSPNRLTSAKLLHVYKE